MDDFSIKPLSENDTLKLEGFLDQNIESTIFHTMAWHKVIQTTYGHQCDYWAAWSNGEIKGIFPVVVVRHPILGTKMVAMAYQMHSGLPIATSEPIQSKLVEHALDRAGDAGAKYLEIRHYEPVPFLEKMGFVPVDSQLVTTSVPLKGLDFKRVRRGHRRNVVYAGNHGVAISEGGFLSDLKMFRRMHLIEGRELGAPQAGWNFFENLHHLARSSYRLLLAWLEDRCLGGLLTVDDGRVVFARYGAYSSPEALRLYVGKALLWQAISDAAQRGCLSFNLGISWCRDSGLIHNKEGWNGVTRPVYIYVYPLRTQAPVPGSYFEGFTLAKAIWRRLPLPVVDWAGRMVTRWIC